MEHIRTWERNGFRLELFDTGGRVVNTVADGYGRSVLAYELWDAESFPNDPNPLFAGADFCCPPMYAIDCDEVVSSLLGFLSLRPGDTDEEYFADYSQGQRDWTESGRAELLSSYAYELEEGYGEQGEEDC